MDDRYLYRAKRFDNGELVEGSYVYREKEDGEHKSHHFILVHDEYGFIWREVDPSTICQCTGLKDKNGKLIFENDIVCGKMYLDHGQWGESVDDKRIVKWRDDFAKFDPCSYMKLDKYEVIGNIFDNPELLEVKS